MFTRQGRIMLEWRETQVSEGAAMDSAVSTDPAQLEGQRPGLVYAMVPPNRTFLPIYLELTETGAWLATNPHILVHGIGETAEEAAAEFIEMALDQYEVFRDDPASLLPDMLEELAYLAAHFAHSGESQ